MTEVWERFTPGDEATWTGLSHQFERRVRIVAARNAYLAIAGETPEDGELVYDIHDPVIKGTVYGIPAAQLAPVHFHGWYEDMEEARALCPACLKEAAGKAADVNPYEAACERYNQATENYPKAKAEADRILREADDEWHAAADLAQYEQSPGIPLPQYREEVSAG